MSGKTNGKVKNPKKRCINCGRAMRQQFIGLKHCKCGTSRSKADGYFQHNSDMVFALERVKLPRKVKTASGQNKYLLSGLKKAWKKAKAHALIFNGAACPLHYL